MVPNFYKKFGRAVLRPFSVFPAALLMAAVFISAPAHADDSVSAKERKCLATAVYFEARGEVERGQVGVAQVILNRVESDAYPDTICGVVFQNQHKRHACQFSFACDGKADTPTEPHAWNKAKAVAKDVLDGSESIPEVGKAMHYHARYVHPRWARKMRRVSMIGSHIFYQG